MSEQLPVHVETGHLPALTPAAVMQQVEQIQALMKHGMKDGTHFGTIPGCGDKPALLKPGAEKLGFMFHLVPEFMVELEKVEADVTTPPGHREYRITCRLTHRDSDVFCGEGVGSCSTMETKYRYRQEERACPKCGSPAIIKGKAEYGGGWLCWGKKGGCGAKFPDDAPEIKEQVVGKVENPDIADTYNTVFKMAKKRAHVDAMLTATAASDVFAQDIEEGHLRAALGVRQDAPASPPPAEPESPAAAVATTELGPDDEPILRTVFFGKNKGTAVAELTEKQLMWYRDRALGKVETDKATADDRALLAGVREEMENRGLDPEIPF